MPRYLVILVVAVVVVAVGAVVVLAMLGRGSSPSASPGATISDDSSRSADVDRQASGSTPSGPSAGQGKETTVPASTVTASESAEPEQVTPPAEVGDPAAWAAAYLDSLSEERQDALQKELWRRAARKAQEQYKYQLPTDLKLYGLEWHNRGANKLDDSQKSRLRQLAESFRPRMDAALQAAWAEGAALDEQISAASSSGRHEEMAGLFEKKHQIMQQINTIKADLDKEYRESVRSILTPEQLQFLDTSQVQMIQSWGGERPR